MQCSSEIENYTLPNSLNSIGFMTDLDNKLQTRDEKQIIYLTAQSLSYADNVS